MTYKPTFTESEVAVIQQALMYFWENNPHFTQQQFEAFPTTVDTESNVIYDFAFANAEAADPTDKPDTTVIINQGNDVYVATIENATDPKILLANTTTNNITVSGGTAAWTKNGVKDTNITAITGATLINAYSFTPYNKSSEKTVEIPLEVGSYTTWYII